MGRSPRGSARVNIAHPRGTWAASPPRARQTSTCAGEGARTTRHIASSLGASINPTNGLTETTRVAPPARAPPIARPRAAPRFPIRSSLKTPRTTPAGALPAPPHGSNPWPPRAALCPPRARARAPNDGTRARIAADRTLRPTSGSSFYLSNIHTITHGRVLFDGFYVRRARAKLPAGPTAPPPPPPSRHTPSAPACVSV